MSTLPTAVPDTDVPDTDVPDTDVLAQRVADVVTADPAVARLDGGVFGSVATYLPGRRLVGVRIGNGDEPVEIGVVLHVTRPIPAVADGLRRSVAAVCAAHGHPVAAVDVHVTDLHISVPAGPGPDPR